MDKSALVERLRSLVSSQYERALSALAGATEAATGDDTKAESKYDTRGLEASYLAAGQAEQADELAEAIASLENAEFPDFDFDDPIGPGALVEAEQDGEVLYYLLAPAGGGITLETEDGLSVTVLGPSAPLRANLLGKSSGTILEEIDLTILEVL
ncbi:MAG: transcription elongation factor GreAB [Verrucomicrobiota bacterium]